MKKLLISLLVCISVIFVSCSRPADLMQKSEVPVGAHVFTPKEINYILMTNGILANFRLTDTGYVAPELKWLKGQFSDSLTKFLFDFNLNNWTKESSDCDDISRAAAVHAGILFQNSKNRPKGVGLLFGEYHYFKAGLGGHAINIILVKDGEIYKIVFYEPQRKFLIDVSDNERFGSIWGRF